MTIRPGNIEDLDQLRKLALRSWSQFQDELTPENWQQLFNILNNLETYTTLLDKADCIVCETAEKAIVGMAFLVPSGHATEIYKSEWCIIRFLTVDPEYGSKGIGRQLTEKCIELAKSHNEQTIALHTSEMMNRARHIYERLGFTILREIEPRFGKKYWLYTLDLA
ncbi:GNAT family N-acetyltransferase [Niastella vici]|nr:N-acetyltransferase [Niastella vici]